MYINGLSVSRNRSAPALFFRIQAKTACRLAFIEASGELSSTGFFAKASLSFALVRARPCSRPCPPLPDRPGPVPCRSFRCPRSDRSCRRHERYPDAQQRTTWQWHRLADMRKELVAQPSPFDAPATSPAIDKLHRRRDDLPRLAMAAAHSAADPAPARRRHSDRSCRTGSWLPGCRLSSTH